MITLLTGASGLVGGDWLPRLLAERPERQIVALSRKPAGWLAHPRVRSIEADLAMPGIGLAASTRSELEGSVTEIIHCAADIRFGLPIEQARACNVEGTRHLLDLARRCRGIRKFAHLSSVYAAGRETGDFFEEPFRVSHGFINTYQQSKYEAEALVIQAMKELPAVIFRLSSIIGDSSGRVRQFNYFHQLVKMIPRLSIVRAIPANPDAPVDLICSNWAATVLSHLFENCFAPGRIYHVCAGPEASLTVRRLVDITFEFFTGLRPPELVSRAEFERYSHNGTVSEMLRLLEQFMPHLELYQAFRNPHTARDLAAAGIAPARIRESYPKVVQYCLDTDWGRAL